MVKERNFFYVSCGLRCKLGGLHDQPKAVHLDRWGIVWPRAAGKGFNGLGLCFELGTKVTVPVLLRAPE